MPTFKEVVCAAAAATFIGEFAFHLSLHFRNFHAILAWMFQANQYNLRELREILSQQKLFIEQLILGLDSPDTAPVHLVELIEATELLDRRKAELVRAFRDSVSSFRMREEDRSVRQVILRALEFVGSPQPAWFLQELVWARDRIDLKTRGFGSLRRDEFRAWRRRPGQRLAYIVPALDSNGHAIAALLARSDWPLANRLAVDGAKRLFALKGLKRVFRAREEALPQKIADPYWPFLERCVAECGISEPPSPQGDEAGQFIAFLCKEVRVLEEVLNPVLAERSHELALLPDEQQLWGKI